MQKGFCEERRWKMCQSWRLSIKSVTSSSIKIQSLTIFILEKCVGNEVYTDCGSACGDDTCDNYKEPRMCIMMCKSGCFCPPDFVRNSSGQCIPKEKCPWIAIYSAI